MPGRGRWFLLLLSHKRDNRVGYRPVEVAMSRVKQPLVLRVIALLEHIGHLLALVFFDLEEGILWPVAHPPTVAAGRG